eukprot:2798953-Prymnesium_polylepis.1
MAPVADASSDGEGAEPVAAAAEPPVAEPVAAEPTAAGTSADQVPTAAAAAETVERAEPVATAALSDASSCGGRWPA